MPLPPCNDNRNGKPQAVAAPSRKSIAPSLQSQREHDPDARGKQLHQRGRRVLRREDGDRKAGAPSVPVTHPRMQPEPHTETSCTRELLTPWCCPSAMGLQEQRNTPRLPSVYTTRSSLNSPPCEARLPPAWLPRAFLPPATLHAAPLLSCRLTRPLCTLTLQTDAPPKGSCSNLHLLCCTIPLVRR